MNNLLNSDMTEPIYSVSEAARILGVHPQTVRFYDKKGVIIPKKDKLTGRRTYSLYDVYQISFRKQFLNMKFTVDETERALHDFTLADFSSMVEKHRQTIEANMMIENARYQGILELQERVNNIPRFLDRFFFKNRPAVWRHPHIRNGILLEDDDSVKARKILMDLMPLTTYSLTFSFEDTQTANDETICAWDVALREPYAQQFGLNKIKGSNYVKSESCVYTIVKAEGKDMLKWNSLSKTLDFLKYNHLKISGNVYGNLIASVRDDTGNMMRYFEVWLPI